MSTNYSSRKDSGHLSDGPSLTQALYTLHETTSVHVYVVTDLVAQPPQRWLMHCDLPFPTLDEIAAHTR